MKLLNSLNHFDFCYNYATSAYEFSTDDGIIYIITFLEYDQVMDVDFPIYSFIIDRYHPQGEKSKDTENKIRNTILKILSNFFESNQSALVAIYDSTDGKQFFRKRLFDRWYNQFNDGSISKKEGTFQAEGNEIYAVAMYSSFHEHKSVLEKQFQALLLNNFYN